MLSFNIQSLVHTVAGIGLAPGQGYGGGVRASVFWMLIDFSCQAESTSGFQMKWELLLIPGGHFLAETSCL